MVTFDSTDSTNFLGKRQEFFLKKMGDSCFKPKCILFLSTIIIIGICSLIYIIISSQNLQPENETSSVEVENEIQSTNSIESDKNIGEFLQVETRF